MRLALKRVIVALLSAPGVRRLLLSPKDERVAIFMLHRFENPSAGLPGVSPDALRRGLRLLRRRGYHSVSLADVFRRLAGEGPPLRNAVAFTMDDGYRDQARIGARIFIEEECPVTIFLISGFLDGRLVPWWDQIARAFRHTRHSSLEVDVEARVIRYSWTHARQRAVAQREFTELCKTLPDAVKHQAIRQLAATAGVELLQEPEEPYLPMTWNEARQLEGQNVTFGPHTVHHPILSRVPDAEADEEIRRSWRRLNEELKAPLPVFCFPNGTRADYGAREIAVLRELGFWGSLTTRGDYTDVRVLQNSVDDRFELGRFGISGDPTSLIRYASGAELIIRRLQSLWQPQPTARA